MRAGCLISLFMWAAIFAVYVLIAGCSSLPTMQYCDKVEYKRDGNKIHVEADCHAPVGAPINLPIPGV